MTSDVLPDVQPDVLPANVSNVVARVVEDYLADLEASLPGLVDGVYLTGSVALADFHEAWSDVDFVTVLRERPTPAQQTRLADVHERMSARHRRPRLDGAYVTWADLAAPPQRDITLGLQAKEGVLRSGRSWVPPILAWHELHDHGLHVHGPGLETADIALDPDALRQWCLGQLAEVWTPWWFRTARLLSAPGLGSLGAWAPASGVLGVVRAHYLLTTGRVTSKCGAGEWALSICEPEWKNLLQECLRIRHRPDRPSFYSDPFRRRRDALAFMDLLMTADEAAFGQALSGT
ncbi:MAG: DUF4111 domain-containing protein [Actinomycetota bacterium]|nr:DUF4111 domain-containing protein [Actinomycetota bacterium]